MLTGGIDLSIPSNLAGAAVLTAFLANGSSARSIWIVPLVIGLGMVVGLINGLGVAYAGVPPIIMTLGMNSAIQGLLLIYTNGGLASAAPTESGQLRQRRHARRLDDAPDLARESRSSRAPCSASARSAASSTRSGTNAGAALALAGVDVRRVLVVPYVVSGAGAARDRRAPARLPRPGVHHHGRRLTSSPRRSRSPSAAPRSWAARVTTSARSRARSSSR